MKNKLLTVFFRYILPKRFRRDYYQRDLRELRKRYVFHAPPPQELRDHIRALKKESKDFVWIIPGGEGRKRSFHIGI